MVRITASRCIMCACARRGLTRHASIRSWRFEAPEERMSSTRAASADKLREQGDGKIRIQWSNVQKRQ